MGPVRGCPGVVGRNRRDRPRPARAEPFEEADGILGVRLRLGAVGHVVVSLSASRPEREASRIWRIVQRNGLCAGGPGGYKDHGVNQLWRRSEEHTSELQSLMRISYAVFCLKKKNKHK